MKFLAGPWMVLPDTVRSIGNWLYLRSTSDLVLAAIVGFMFANLKALPGIWHIRILNYLKSHIIFNRSRKVTAAVDGGQALFEPVVMTSYSPLLEIDYNIHKSNSTFFSDLDISRVDLIGKLFKPALSLACLGGRLDIALGATACTFKRAIMPYEKYEVWSRVLTWDDKWLYIVSHFVKIGTAQKMGKRRSDRPQNSQTTTLQDKEPEFSKAIFASAITKYVFKNRRITVQPNQVLQDLHLLPAIDNGDTLVHEKKSSLKDFDSTICRSLGLDSSIKNCSSCSSWDFAHVESERLKGLVLAKSFAAMDGLHDVLLTASYCHSS